MTVQPLHRLRGQSGPRDHDVFPEDDARLGRALFSKVVAALEKGRPAPAAFVIYGDRVDRFSMRTMSGASPITQQRIIAAMAGQADVECLAVLGAFRFRGSGPMNGQWVASVFVEWPDNRWWTAWQPIGPERSLVGEGAQVRCAVDGSPRPGGVGGWFALARRLGLKLRLHRSSTSVH